MNKALCFLWEEGGGERVLQKYAQGIRLDKMAAFPHCRRMESRVNLIWSKLYIDWQLPELVHEDDREENQFYPGQPPLRHRLEEKIVERSSFVYILSASFILCTKLSRRGKKFVGHITWNFSYF